MSDALTAGTVRLIGHGGDAIEGYLARPSDGRRRGGIVVLHHMPGYDKPTKEIVRRFASEGFDALCPNLHHRDAPGASPEEAAAASRAAGGVPDDRLIGDVEGAVRTLKALDDANGKVGVIGYCSGGRQALLAACALTLDAAVDVYGAFVVNDPPASLGLKTKPILDRVSTLSCPLLGLFGAEDANPSPDETRKLAAELDRFGKSYEFHTFENAGHAFFAVNRPNYRPAAAMEGWERILRFFAAHLG